MDPCACGPVGQSSRAARTVLPAGSVLGGILKEGHWGQLNRELGHQ